MTELKKCPFCGEKAEITECAPGHDNHEFTKDYIIGCPSCKVYFIKTTRLRLEEGQPVFIANGYQEAIEAWNRRAE